eukprot:CAMPEP_0175133900 /NCGR_PEP_ID=MMETSP0087-20121206/7891_1 /TAXON_ID=136419 /ORGANISM="Unknown Unknown, Strain D1" /LENGTH=83 /DNA_ID=CAMNT_0016416425 /DNA_START=906 /DNA_END=1154 /DNA_ORIENTATION=+
MGRPQLSGFLVSNTSEFSTSTSPKKRTNTFVTSTLVSSRDRSGRLVAAAELWRSSRHFAPDPSAPAAAAGGGGDDDDDDDDGD